MRYILVLLLFLSTPFLAKELSKEEVQLQKVLQQEKKIAQEQKFYQAKEYDFKSVEVNKETIENLDDQSFGAQVDAANEDFDMDDVY